MGDTLIVIEDTSVKLKPFFRVFLRQVDLMVIILLQVHHEPYYTSRIFFFDAIQHMGPLALVMLSVRVFLEFGFHALRIVPILTIYGRCTFLSPNYNVKNCGAGRVAANFDYTYSQPLPCPLA